MSESHLYRWPLAAKFGRVVPKTKFYEHGAVSKAVRDKFVAEVQRITWAYKLADSTIHLEGDAAVPEIQVFVIDAKEGNVSDDVLAAIDKAVPFPIVFEINSQQGGQPRTRMAASSKELGQSKPRLSAHFSTDWHPADSERRALPSALDLPSLYRGLLAPIFPIALRPGERLSEATTRVREAVRLERDIAKLERRLRVEPQLNRKVELRRELMDRTATLRTLTDSAQHTRNDAPEKDTQWTG